MQNAKRNKKSFGDLRVWQYFCTLFNLFERIFKTLFMQKTIGVLILFAVGLFSVHRASAQTITYERDTLVLNDDSVLIITTACAPICSSVVMVENKDGKSLGRLYPPFEHAVFPEAYIEDKRLHWRDNTPTD